VQNSPLEASGQVRRAALPTLGGVEPVLERLGDLTTVDWRRLSEISQTYRAVSAVLAMLAALCSSIRLQQAQTVGDGCCL
jgi:hypothetical protein